MAEAKDKAEKVGRVGGGGNTGKKGLMLERHKIQSWQRLHKLSTECFLKYTKSVKIVSIETISV